MGHGFREALRLAGTVALGVTAGRAVDSVRSALDELDIQPDEGPGAAVVPSVDKTDGQDKAGVAEPHAFGPKTAVATYRGVGFRPPTAMAELEAERERVQPAPVQAKEPAPASVQRFPEADTDMVVRDLHSASSAETAASIVARQALGSVSGTITNVHGRGLRGLRVEVVDVDKAVVCTSTTGADGQYLVDDIEPGTYKLRVLDDVDGDFEKSWIGGESFKTAEKFTIKAEKTRRAETVVLRSTARIDVEVESTKKKVDVIVTVTHRATGEPATGEIEMSTKDVKVTVALADGKGRVLLRQAAKTLRIDYQGDQRTRPESTKIRLL
jgi:hypothetical protein